MPLTIALRKGHDFYVDGHRFIVSVVNNPVDCVVKTPTGKMIRIRGDGWTNVADGVDLRPTPPRDQGGSIVRLAINAVREKKILRGEEFRKVRVRSSVCESCKGMGVLRDKRLCENCGGFGCQKCTGGFVYDTFKCPDCGGVK